MFGRSAKSMDEFDKELLREYDLIDDDVEKELCDLERKPRAKVRNRASTDTHRHRRGDNMRSKYPDIPNARSAEDALEQRLSKYQSGVESALKEGDSSKTRRMSRIVKQYEDALKALKAGDAVDFSQLPNPPGYPPIPECVSSKTPPLPVPVQESGAAVLTAKPKTPVIGVAMAQGHGRSRPAEGHDRSRPAEGHGSYGRAEDKVEVDPSVLQSKNLLEAQRHEKCRTGVDSCKAEGNGSNAQQKEQTVKQKKVAVKPVKAGRKEIDSDQGLCEIFHYLATSTKDANERKSIVIQCISKMDENTLSMVVRMIAEKLEASPKVAEEETGRALSEGTGIQPVQPVDDSDLALSGGDVWRDSVNEQVLLGHFQDQFLKEMKTAAIVHEEDQDIISSPDTMKIRESPAWTELNEALCDKQTCTKAMRGHPKEGALDADMKSMLEEPVFRSEPLLKEYTHVTVRNEPPVDDIQDSPPSSDALGETQDGQSVLQYQPKTLPVAPPPTPPTTPPHNGEEGCDEPVMAEEDALEVRHRRAASFTDEHSSQPSVPQGGPPYTPDSAQELYPSSDASGLKFSEQQKEESPQPYPPGGGGPVMEVEQLTEESPQPYPPGGGGPVMEVEQLTEESPQPYPPGGGGPVMEVEQLTEESPQPYPPGGVGPVKVMEQLDNAVEEHGPRTQRDAESVDDEQAMTEKGGSKAKDRIGGVDFHVNVCLGLRSGPLHVLVKIGSAVCRIAQGDTIVGSGSVVRYNEKFHFLTVGHIFLTRKKGGRLKYLNDDDVQKMKENCKLVQYHFSAIDFMSTVALPAAVVLKNYDDPKLVFDKLHDLLAIEVNDPAGFSARLEAEEAAALHPIHPIPLQPSVRIADCLKDDVWLMIAHFPWEKIDEDNDHRAKCLETSCGLRRIVNVQEDTLVTYMLDTYHGSSGAPVLLATDDGKLVLVAVHRKFSRASGVCKIGSILNEDFLSRL